MLLRIWCEVVDTLSLQNNVSGLEGTGKCCQRNGNQNTHLGLCECVIGRTDLDCRACVRIIEIFSGFLVTLISNNTGCLPI